MSPYIPRYKSTLGKSPTPKVYRVAERHAGVAATLFMGVKEIVPYDKLTK